MRTKSSNSARARYLRVNYSKVSSEIHAYARRLAKKLDVKLVLLFGSLAKNTYAGFSDADVLVVANGLPARSLDRYVVLVDNSLTLPVEPRGYAPNEFIESLEKAKDLGIFEAMETGIVISADEDFLKKAKNTFLAAKQKFQLMKTGRGWRIENPTAENTI